MNISFFKCGPPNPSRFHHFSLIEFLFLRILYIFLVFLFFTQMFNYFNSSALFLLETTSKNEEKVKF